MTCQMPCPYRFHAGWLGSIVAVGEFAAGFGSGLNLNVSGKTKVTGMGMAMNTRPMNMAIHGLRFMSQALIGGETNMVVMEAAPIRKYAAVLQIWSVECQT